MVCAHERADDNDLQTAAVTVLLLCMLLQHRLTEKGVSEFYSSSLASLHPELWWLLFWCEVGEWYRNAWQDGGWIDCRILESAGAGWLHVGIDTPCALSTVCLEDYLMAQCEAHGSVACSAMSQIESFPFP